MKSRRFIQALSVVALVVAGAVLGRILPTGELGANESPTNASTVVRVSPQEAPVRYQEADFETDPNVYQAVVAGGVPNGRWKEGLMFEGIEPMPWLASAANWFPNTEQVQPDEMRVTFMGTAPMIRPGQMNTSIFVELGNGDSFIFDIGEGSVANYLASGVPINKMNNIFITHLHVDHFGSLPYVYAFGAWSGRWHEPLRVFGPSGRTPEYGTAAMVDGMKKMMGWHTDAFDVFPVGEGWDVEVTEFDFRDNGGVIYDRNGATVTHWQRSHAKDGASGYRLDWNGLSFVWTGDGRPSQLDSIYAHGVDLYVTETQPEILAISSGVAGVPPFIGRYTVDTHHTPTYAAGLLCKKVQPRLCMNTHMQHDPYQDAEVIAEIREHWDGPYHPGAPDMVVVNVTKDRIWIRDGVVADYPNQAPPRADASVARYGGLVVPPPRNTREMIQESFVREMEINPSEYYPADYFPILLEDWPAPRPLFIPDTLLPPRMLPPEMREQSR